MKLKIQQLTSVPIVIDTFSVNVFGRSLLIVCHEISVRALGT